MIDGGGGNVIGGTTVGAGNVISGNVSHGIEVFSSSGNRIEGNFIGTDASGLAALGNGARGVQLNDSSDNIIGGTEPGARNIISGNSRSGIRLLNPGSTGNLVQGNYIGTDLHGVADLGNGNEGVIINGGSNNTIGGTESGAGNLISGNGGDGVSVIEGAGNSILMNSIYSNNGLGIDLGVSSVTPNDDGDGDSGPNNLQNFPVLDSASTNGSQVLVAGSLSSLANTMFRVEFFSNSGCDPTGNGEGQRLLGFSEIVTGSTGVATINVTLDETASVGEFLTATATVIEGQGDYGDSSEFSGCREVVAGGCIPPFPDFADNGRADAGDALLLLKGILDGNEAFDLTCDELMTGDDLIRFSLEWYQLEASKTQ
ncbi:MAG: hypothetical protein GHCLOJNM_04668 [bacterium]|nr:hypothetical protein [bacterium]